MQLLLAGQLLTTLFMCGLIWFVQLVHYPLMKEVTASGFVRYERRHQRATTRIVAPAMLLELMTAIGLALACDRGTARLLAIVNLGLLGLIWASTLFIQMPIHKRLGRGYDAALIDWLVFSNWLRSGLWSVRSFLVLWLAYEMIG
jgi:hypothetical protein